MRCEKNLRGRLERGRVIRERLRRRGLSGELKG